eukprot:12601-Heterococcus_DN1.PRE.3
MQAPAATAQHFSKSTKPIDPEDIDDDSELSSDSDDEPAVKRRRPLQTDANIALLLEQCSLQSAFDAAYSSAAGRRVLGLDINTSSTGYAVLDIANSSGTDEDAAAAVLLEWGRICTKKADDVLDGGLEITAQLSDIKQRCCSSSGDAPWIVGVEDFAKSFTTGRFHTRSLFKLAQLNGIVKFGCLQTFAVKPEAWHPTSARAFYGLKRGKMFESMLDGNLQLSHCCCVTQATMHLTSSAYASLLHFRAVQIVGEDDDVKQVVFDYVLQREARTEPNAAAAAYTWRTGVGGTKENYDVTDAYLIAVYTWHQHLLSALREDKQLRSAFRAAYRAVHSERLERADAAAAAEAVSAAAAAASAAAQLSDKASKAKVKALLTAHRAAQRKKLDKLYDDAVECWVRDVLVPDTTTTSSSSSSDSSSDNSSDTDDDAAQSVLAVQEITAVKAVRT